MIWEGAPTPGAAARLAELGIAVAVVDPAADIARAADFIDVQNANVDAVNDALR